MSDLEDNGSVRDLGDLNRTSLHSPRHLADNATVSNFDLDSAPACSPVPGNKNRRTDLIRKDDFSQRDNYLSGRGESSYNLPYESAQRGTSVPGRGSSYLQPFYGGMGSDIQPVYPYPVQAFHPYYGHPGMFGSQPMSGMAGVGFAPLPQQTQPASTSGAAIQQSQPASCAVPEPQAGTSGSTEHRRSSKRSGKKPGLSLPRAYESSPPSRRDRSSSRFSRIRGGRSPSLESSVSSRRRGRDPSSSPSPRRSFVRKTRKGRSVSSSSAPSLESGEEEEVLAEAEAELSALSIQECLSLVKGIRPDLVSAGKKSDERVLSAGERALAKRKSKGDSLCFVQSDLVSKTLSNLQSKIRGNKKIPPLDQPADLPHSALKMGDLLPSPQSWHGKTDRVSFLAEGVLPLEKLTPSSSDLSSRSNPSLKTFKPFLKESGLTKIEEAALMGLQCLSVSDSVLGIVADCLVDSDPLDKEYARRPSKEELLQLVSFACKFINRAVGSTARCYLNTILIKRDSFLHSADKLEQDYDKSALRSLPISAPALIGPQVALNVEKWEKRQFDHSVRSIVSKAHKKVEHSPRKRARSTSDQRSASGSKRFYSSAFRSSSSSQQRAGRGRFNPKNQKSKPKASAHPQ